MKRLAPKDAAKRPLLLMLVLPVVLAGGLLNGCGNDGAKKVAVRINKDSVTEDEFLNRVQNVSIAELYPSYQRRGPAKAGEYAMFQVILEHLMEQLGAEKGIKPTDAQVNDYVAFAKRSANSPQGAMVTLMNPDPFRTEETWKRDAKLALIQRGLALAPLKITPDDQKRKYEEIVKTITPADRYHIRIVDCTSKEKAQQALDALNKGVAFETVALRSSDSTSPGSKDGDIGVVESTALPPAWLNAVVNLKPNEYTKQIVVLDPATVGMTSPGSKQQMHYYLLQLLEKLPGKPPSQDDSKYTIELALISEKDPQFFQRISDDMESFKKKADIQVNMPAYKDLVKKMMTPSGGAPNSGAPAGGAPATSAPPTGATAPR